VDSTIIDREPPTTARYLQAWALTEPGLFSSMILDDKKGTFFDSLVVNPFPYLQVLDPTRTTELKLTWDEFYGAAIALPPFPDCDTPISFIFDSKTLRARLEGYTTEPVRLIQPFSDQTFKPGGMVKVAFDPFTSFNPIKLDISGYSCNDKGSDQLNIKPMLFAPGSTRFNFKLPGNSTGFNFMIDAYGSSGQHSSLFWSINKCF
jgi:hypothetical protein